MPLVVPLILAFAGCGRSNRPVDPDAPFTLADAEEQHRSTPDSFEIPAAELRENLSPRDKVKLIFDIADGDVERMWVIVDRKEEDDYVGLLANQPYTSGAMYPGMEIRFEARHVISISTEQASASYRDDLNQIAETSAEIQHFLENIVGRIDKESANLEVVATIAPADTFAEAVQNVRNSTDLEIESVGARGDWFLFGTSTSHDPEIIFGQGLAIRRSGTKIYKYDFGVDSTEAPSDRGR